MNSYLSLNEKSISALTLGLMTNLSVLEEKERLSLYKKAFDLGINSFDSAPNYQEGYSDVFLGKLINEIGRDELFVSNKVYFQNNYSKETSLTKKHIIKTVEGSLKAMNTDYFDCLVLHRFDNNTSVESTLKVLEILYKSGKIKQWGISAFSGEQLLDYYYQSKFFDLPELSVAQYAYNLFNRTIEKGLNSIFLNKGIKVFAYYPLAQGVLTGKYSQTITNSRANDEFFKEFMWDNTPEKLNIANDLLKFCKSEGLDIISLAYQWCLRNKNVVSLITNVRDEEQLNHNINCLKSVFNSEIRFTLDTIFNNKPLNQYTGQAYEISERTL